MRGENNLFLNALRTAPAPWQHKIANSTNNSRTDTVVDYTGRPIAHIAPAGGTYTPEQYLQTIKLIELSPNLLAALTELLFNWDLENIVPNESLVDLVYECGGADLRDHFAAKRSNLEQAQSRKPQTWDNASQSLKDSE